jgi:molybdopterin synthase catalytic subunit
MIDILLTSEPLKITSAIDKVLTPASGGIDVFIGTVRNNTNGETVIKLEFDAYDTMAVSEMRKIADQAMVRWKLHNLVLWHRKGVLEVGEIPVIIAVSAAHRGDAFDACRFCIDTLKQTVPIWKKEIFVDGDVWVAAHP